MNQTIGSSSTTPRPTQLGVTREQANPLQGLDREGLKKLVANLSQEDLQALFQELKPTDQENLKKMLIALGYANLAALLTVANNGGSVIETDGPNLTLPQGVGLGAPEDTDQAPAVADGPVGRAKIKNLSIILDRVISSLIKQNQNMTATQGEMRKLMTMFAEALARYTVHLKVQNAEVTALQANTAADEQYKSEMIEVENHKLAAYKSFAEATVSTVSMVHSVRTSKAEDLEIDKAKDNVATAQATYDAGTTNNPLPEIVTDRKVFKEALKDRIKTLEDSKDNLKAAIKADKKILKDADADEPSKKLAKESIANYEKQLKEVNTGLDECNNLKWGERFDAPKELLGKTSHKEAAQHRRLEGIHKAIGAGDKMGLSDPQANDIKGHQAKITDLKEAKLVLNKTIHDIRSTRTKHAEMFSTIAHSIAGGGIELQTADNKNDATAKRNEAEIDRAYGKFLEATGEAANSVISELLQDLKETLRAEKDEVLQALSAISDALSRLLQAQQSASSM